METTLTYEKVLELILKQSEEHQKRLEQTEQRFLNSLEKSRAEFEADLKKSRKEYDARLNQFESRWGRFVESLTRAGLIELFAQQGIKLEKIHSNVFMKKNGQMYYEIDLFAINTIYVVAVEVKTTLTVDDVKEHLKRLDKMQELPPDEFNLTGKSILGAVAGITAQKEAIDYALKNGLFVLSQQDSLLDIQQPNEMRLWTID